jgi:hypothetical protein
MKSKKWRLYEFLILILFSKTMRELPPLSALKISPIVSESQNKARTTTRQEQQDMQWIVAQETRKIRERK